MVILLLLPSPVWNGGAADNLAMALAYIAGTALSALAGKIGILVATHAINSKQAKTVMEDLVSRGVKPAQSVAEHGFEQISDSGAIQAIVDEVVAAHPEAVEDWKHGKDRILGFLVGQVLKASHGKANPSMAREMVLAKIGPMGQRP